MFKEIFIPCKENKHRPKFLTSDFAIYCVLFLLILKLAIFPFLACFPKTTFFADISKIILVDLTNKERESLGFSSLDSDTRLEEAARRKAQDMIDHDYFSHQSPDGTEPWYWVKQAGYE